MPAPAPAGHVPAYTVNTSRGRYRIRTATAGDRAALQRMLEEAAPEDLRLRFFHSGLGAAVSLIEPMLLADERAHFAFVALEDGLPERIVGSGMLVAEPGGRSAEFALLVSRRHAGQGLGTHLLHCLMQEARAHGIATVYGLILTENTGMIELVRHYGFQILRADKEPGVLVAEIDVSRAPVSLADLPVLPLV